jgi:glycerophosphoryl diester phosphodiesterase
LSDLTLNAPGKILNIAHRGSNAAHPENTMPAFRAAVREQADMIELDVRLSKDGLPIVFHDPKLPNAPSSKKQYVKDYTLAELKTIAIGSAAKNGNGKATIPSLVDVLKFAKGQIPINIEIKTGAVTDHIKNGIEQKCLQLLEKYEMLGQVLFSSFDMRSIKHIKQLKSTIPTAVLYSKNVSGIGSPAQIVRQYNADAFHCTYHQLSKKWAQNLQANNIPVLVYTINRHSRMKKSIDLGVNGIFTDKPDVLADVLLKQVK